MVATAVKLFKFHFYLVFQSAGELQVVQFGGLVRKIKQVECLAIFVFYILHTLNPGPLFVL